MLRRIKICLVQVLLLFLYIHYVLITCSEGFVVVSNNNNLNNNNSINSRRSRNGFLNRKRNTRITTSDKRRRRTTIVDSTTTRRAHKTSIITLFVRVSINDDDSTLTTTSTMTMTTSTMDTTMNKNYVVINKDEITTTTAIHNMSLQPISIYGDKQDSFLNAMSVPTYKLLLLNNNDDEIIITNDCTKIISHSLENFVLCKSNNNNNNIEKDCIINIRKELEEQIYIQPSFVIENLFNKQFCKKFIQLCDKSIGSYKVGKNFHGAMQMIVPNILNNIIAKQIQPYIEYYTNNNINSNDDIVNNNIIPPIYKYQFIGLNRRWRIYRYKPGGIETFAPHIDAGFPPSGLSGNGNELIFDITNQYSQPTVVSRLTILFYLNDDFIGGETNFFKPMIIQSEELEVLASVKPKTGSCLIFPQAVGEKAIEYARIHWPLHEGSPVQSGSNSPKYVIRSDILFADEEK